MGPSFFLKALVLFSLGMVSWSGHIFHISMPTLSLILCGVSPEILPAPQNLLLTPVSLSIPDDYSLQLLYYSALHHLFAGIALLIISLCCLSLKNSINSLPLSWDYIVSGNLFFFSAAAFMTANLLTYYPVYPFLSTDLPVLYSVFTHHVWIAMFLAVGGFSHFSIGFLRSLKGKSLRRLIFAIVHHRELILSHLSWVCIFLGLHSFGLLVHNDTMEALGRIDDTFTDYTLQLKPLFYDISFVENSSSPLLYDFSSAALVSHKLAGTSEFIVAHIPAFNAHVSLLITLKGILFARSSRFVADK